MRDEWWGWGEGGKEVTLSRENHLVERVTAAETTVGLCVRKPNCHDTREDSQPEEVKTTPASPSLKR